MFTLKSLGTALLRRPRPAARPRLRVEVLEARDVPARLDLLETATAMAQSRASTVRDPQQGGLGSEDSGLVPQAVGYDFLRFTGADAPMAGAHVTGLSAFASLGLRTGNNVQTDPRFQPEPVFSVTHTFNPSGGGGPDTTFIGTSSFATTGVIPHGGFHPIPFRLVPDLPGEAVGQPVRLTLTTEFFLRGEQPGQNGSSAVQFQAAYSTGGVVVPFGRGSHSVGGGTSNSSESATVDARIGDVIWLGVKTVHTFSYQYDVDAEPNFFQAPQLNYYFRLLAAMTPRAETDVSVTDAAWNTNRGPGVTTPQRGFDYTVTVTGSPGRQTVPVEYYWSADDQFDPGDRLAGTATVAAGRVNEPARGWGTPPTDASYILVVVDPHGLVTETSETNNVAALPLRSAAELLSGSLKFMNAGDEERHGSRKRMSSEMVAFFEPGGGEYTLSEAEVRLGVDHFNWLQTVTDLSPRLEWVRQTGLFTYEPIPRPMVDPDYHVEDMKYVAVRVRSSQYVVHFEARPLDALPFYLDEFAPESRDDMTVLSNTWPKALKFYDPPVNVYNFIPGTGSIDPDRSMWVPGESTRFRTQLTGVGSDGAGIPLPLPVEFLWESDSHAPQERTEQDFTTVGGSARILQWKAGDISGGASSAGSGGGPVGGGSSSSTGGRPGGTTGAVTGRVSVPRTSTIGTGPDLRSLNPDGSVRSTSQPFGPGASIRTATADFTGDGVPDVVAGTGPGRSTRVVILDGATGAEVFAFDPFEPAFTGGVFVAAGDLNGDGTPDLVVTPDEGGGPRVRVFSGRGFAPVADFFAIDDPNFRGGCRAAVGDIDGDGAGDLLVSAGFGGGPRVAGFDGRSLSAGRRKLFADFFVFEPALRNGAYLAAGDMDGDGKADLIAGAGPGGGPRVVALSGAALLAGRREMQADFFAGDTGSRGGVRVAAKDLDGDGRADLVVGSGAGGTRVTAYHGRHLSAGGAPPAAFTFDLGGDPVGGVYVG